MNDSKNQTIAKSDKGEGNNSKDFDQDHFDIYPDLPDSCVMNNAGVCDLLED